MASTDRPGGFTEPEVGSASGGHLTPDAASGSPYDASGPAGRDRGGSTYAGSERTALFPRDPEEGAPPLTRESATSRRVRKATTRRVRRRIRHIDVFSVLKISAFFYMIFLIVWLVFVAIIYSVVDATGFIDAIENLGPSLVLWERADITLGVVERWAFFIGLFMAVLGTLLNTLLAVLYNLASDLLGGLELTFVERDL